MSAKRQISVEEKCTLKSLDKYALTLLGPGCPEVQELKDVGFPERRIIGIDRTLENIQLAQRYYPYIATRYMDFGRFWETEGHTYEYSYIHLDFCGQATPNMVSLAVSTVDSIVSGGRLRVTFSGSLARLNRARGEAFLLEQVVASIRTAVIGRATLIDSRYYTSSLAHKETYITAWFDR